MTAGRDERLAVISLIAVTAAWGSTFVVMKSGIAQMSYWSLTSLRWAIAFALLAVFRPRALRTDRRTIQHGLAIGVVSSFGYLFQTVGLLTIDASVSGFITGMFVVLTPIFASVLFRDRISGWAWVGVLLALVGLGLISLHGFSLSSGAVWTLIGAAMWALQIISTAHWSTRENSYSIATYQILMVAVFFTIGSAVQGYQLPPNAGVWGDILVMSVFASALAFTVQTWGQSHVDATRAAVIFTMEPMFAGIFGVWIDHDPMTVRIISGAGLIFAAMFISEFAPKRSRVVDEFSQPHITT